MAAIADSPLHRFCTLNTVVHVRVPVSHFLIGFTFLVQHFLLFSPAAQSPLFAIFDTFCILLYLVVPCFFSFFHRLLYVSVVSPRSSFSSIFSVQLGCVHGWTLVRCDFFLPPLMGATPDIFIVEGYSDPPPPPPPPRRVWGALPDIFLFEGYSESPPPPPSDQFIIQIDSSLQHFHFFSFLFSPISFRSK